MAWRCALVLLVSLLAAQARAADGPSAKTYVPAGENLLKNGSFEQWKAGVPVAWTLAMGQCDAWAPAKAKQGADARAGKVSLKLPPPAAPGDGLRLTQSAALPQPAPPRLHASIAVLCDAPGGVTLMLLYRAGGQDAAAQAACAGTGTWEVLALEAELPPDTDPASFSLVLERVPAATGDVLLDDAQLRAMAEAAPVTSAPVEPRRKPKFPHGMAPK